MPRRGGTARPRYPRQPSQVPRTLKGPAGTTENGPQFQLRAFPTRQPEGLEESSRGLSDQEAIPPENAPRSSRTPKAVPEEPAGNVLLFMPAHAALWLRAPTGARRSCRFDSRHPRRAKSFNSLAHPVSSCSFPPLRGLTPFHDTFPRGFSAGPKARFIPAWGNAPCHRLILKKCPDSACEKDQPLSRLVSKPQTAPTYGLTLSLHAYAIKIRAPVRGASVRETGRTRLAHEVALKRGKGG